MNVLFLCTGNYYRSRFAEEYFNSKAREKGILHRASSRGLAENFERHKNPGPMSLDALSELRRCGVIMRRPIRKLSLRDKAVIYWNIKDLIDIPASIALPECRRKIDLLIQNLA
jgi:protein-tyrosine-phosphatase